MNLKDIGCKGLDWNQRIQDGDKWHNSATTIMNIPASRK
jgi:hypothetical protein